GPRHRQQIPRAGRRRGARQGRHPCRHHPLHPAPPARPLRSQGPHGGGMTMRRSLLDWRGWAAFLAIGFILLVVLPAMNAWAAPGSTFSLPNYLVPLLGKYACYAI